MVTVNYEYKLQPNKQQIETFETWLNVCKKVYNFALRERKDWVNSRSSAVNACSLVSEYILPADTPRPTYYSQCKSLTAAKKKIEELTLPHIHVLQQTLRQLEAAFVAMWDRGHGFPRFVRRSKSLVLSENIDSGNRGYGFPVEFILLSPRKRVLYSGHTRSK